MGDQHDLFSSVGTPAGGGKPKRGDTKHHDRIAHMLSAFSVPELEDIYRALVREGKLPIPKIRLVEAIASMLDIASREDYEMFLVRLDPRLRALVVRGVFESWIPRRDFEAVLGPLFPTSQEPYYSYLRRIDPTLQLGLFIIDFERDHLDLLGWLRPILAPFAPRPEGLTIAALSTAPAPPWSVAASITDILPLFRKRLASVLASKSTWEMLRKGLTKTALADLKKASGLPAFSAAAEEGLDSAGILARFLMLFDWDTSSQEPWQFIKLLVDRFFLPLSREALTNIRQNVGTEAFDLAQFALSSYEQICLFDHLSGYKSSLLTPAALPVPARRDFRTVCDILEEIEKARSGGWADARALFTALDLRQHRFAVVKEDAENESLGLKADVFLLKDKPQDEPLYEHTFRVDGPYRRECLARPVFEQYVYLFATLGLFEIAEAEPPRLLIRKGKEVPICPADCLAAIRLTPLGRWCLGYTKELPALQVTSFEALADEELLLVTFRGTSLERRIYLDTVATPLGVERWRFSEARFIAGCDSPAQIEARIADFRRLIAPKPSARWEAFFSTCMARASVLSAIVPAYLLPLPPDPAIRRVFIDNPRIRAIVKRVEGEAVLVEAEHFPALVKLLAAEGFWAPDLKKLRT